MKTQALYIKVLSKVVAYITAYHICLSWFLCQSNIICCLLQLLNQIVCELPPEHPVSSVRPLRDSLGHTPLQVCNNLKFDIHGHDLAYLVLSYLIND